MAIKTQKTVIEKIEQKKALLDKQIKLLKEISLQVPIILSHEIWGTSPKKN